MSRGHDTEGCWNEFKQLLLSLESKYVPRKNTTAQNSGKAIWMTYRATNLVSRKRAVFAKYKDKDHPAVKTINKKVSKEVKKAKKQFEKKLAQNIKSDVKSYYAYVRSKCKSRVKTGQLEDEEGSLTVSEQ